jgi:nucleoid-associated protein YgaU
MAEKPIGPQWTQGAQSGQRATLGQSCPGNPASAASGGTESIQSDSVANLATPPAPAREPEHLYDTAPAPTAKQFLLNIVHDPHSPLTTRIKAADTLLRLFGPDAFYPPPTTIQIGGLQ